MDWSDLLDAHARLRVPLLLLPTESFDGTTAPASRRAWSLYGHRLGNIPVPEAAGRSFLFASHHGWMLSVCGKGQSAALVNPFAGGSVGLPALPSSFAGGKIRDLSWDWSPHGVVVAPPFDRCQGKGAFFCRPGDESWTPVGCSSACITSVTYCDRAFYLLDGRTFKVTAIDAETLAVAAVIEPPPPPALGSISPTCMVNIVIVSSDEMLLLLIELMALLCPGVNALDKPKVFRASRAASGDQSLSWSEVAGGGIGGGRAVFVDHLRAFCVEANALNGLKGNCMYVARGHEEVNDDDCSDYVDGSYTVHVLDFADLESVQLSFNERRSGFLGWPSWSLPNLQ